MNINTYMKRLITFYITKKKFQGHRAPLLAHFAVRNCLFRRICRANGHERKKALIIIALMIPLFFMLFLIMNLIQVGL